MRLPYDVRADIPLTSQLIYFDNAATCLTPKPVVDAIDEYYLEYRANIHRGVHRLSQKASLKYDEAREKVAQFLGASFEEIIFVKNTTEALNYVALGLEWKKRDKIVVSELEHHSNFLPFMKLQKKGVKIEVIKCDTNGMLIEEEFSDKIRGARLVSLSHISNLSGAVTPLEEISKITKENNALLCIDAAQSVGHRPVDVGELTCDFLAFPAHKGIMGPTGVGILYVSKTLFDEFTPLFVGGGIVTDVSLDSYSLTDPPGKYEAGTPNIAGVIGVGAAVDYVSRIGLDNIVQYEDRLVQKTITAFDKIPNLEWYGPRENHAGVFSFNIKGYSPHDVAAVLDESGGIMVRSGHHCALPAIKKLGLKGAARASYHCYNTEEEIDTMVQLLWNISKNGAETP
jgi:cysteine desulfurase/selenocysteine lyase